MLQTSVLDPKNIKFGSGHPDTGFWPNLDMDPDPGLPYVFNFGEKKIKNSFGGNKFL